MPTVLRNPLGILTGLPGSAARAHGDIRIDAGRIAAVGADIAQPGDTLLDASNCVVTPGLVSAHHHLFQTMLKAVPAGMDARLEPWLARVPYTYWRRMDDRALQVAATVGLVELLLSGCTTVADHHYPFVDHLDAAAILFDTAERLGLRLVLARGSATLSRALDESPAMPTETLDRMLANTEALAARYHDPAPDARRRIAFAPSTPTWGLDAGELREAAAGARAMGLRLHSHLSETGTYVEYTQARYGARPVHWLAEHGWLGPDVWFAHLVHVDDSEIGVLAQTGTGMAHCPQSNGRLGSGIAPADALDRAGGVVALGADGAASNEACDMVSEMHAAFLLHRARRGAAAVRADDVLRWATAGGAAALGLPAIGTIAPGQAADLAAFDLGHPRYAGMHDPLVAPVASGGGAALRHVLVAGRPVLRDGAIPGIDLAELGAQARDVVARLDA